jgi:hypothetical protein
MTTERTDAPMLCRRLMVTMNSWRSRFAGDSHRIFVFIAGLAGEVEPFELVGAMNRMPHQGKRRRDERPRRRLTEMALQAATVVVGGGLRSSADG